jgi:hypothetical protein
MSSGGSTLSLLPSPREATQKRYEAETMLYKYPVATCREFILVVEIVELIWCKLSTEEEKF